MGMDLRCNCALPGAVLTQDQDGAITVGNPGNRSLNPRLRKRGQPRLPLPIMNHCNCCHSGTMFIIFSSSSSWPRSANQGMGSLVDY